MSDPNERARFFAKLAVGGGCAVAGALCLWGGYTSFRDEAGVTAALLALLGLCLGVAFLRTAWKISGE